MSSAITRIYPVFGVLGLCFLAADFGQTQEPPPPALTIEVAQDPPAPEVPKGLEVLARGPVHEAFATPTAEPKATQAVPRKPPANMEEMPPEEKPEGDVVWIGGYWGWDDDRQDYLWVSGCWRVKPENKEWVPGYWREASEQWQWVPGFWTNATAERQEVTYYPDPPAPPNIAPPAETPPDQFFVPGYWMWTGNHYAWRAGYLTRTRPGFVYVASHYRWTPYGHVFVAGYWDYSVARRGLLYAPVVVDPLVVGPRFVYTPYYAVRDTLVLDAFFVRTSHCHYYFGDYYGPRYATLGFEPCIVYSRRHYEPIMVYQRWEYRNDPRWYGAQVTLVYERNAGRAPLPPRTLVQQNTVINNVTNVTNVTNVKNVNVTNVTNTTNNVQKVQGLASAKNVLAARGDKAVTLDATTRTQVKQTTQAVQQSVATERKKTESAPPAATGASARPRTAALNVPTSQPAGKAAAFVTTPGVTAGQPLPGGVAKPAAINLAPLGGAAKNTIAPASLPVTKPVVTTGSTPTLTTTGVKAAPGSDPLNAKKPSNLSPLTQPMNPASTGKMVLAPSKTPPPAKRPADEKKKDRP
jgi:hypothetical protein